MQEQEKFITPEECQELATAMNAKYKIALKGRSFSVSARKDGPGVYVCILLKNPDESFYYPVEGRVMFEAEEMKASEAALFLVDYLDIYFEEFLLEEEESLYLPIDWSDFNYEAVDFQVKGQILNRKLEAMADQFLQENEQA
ncbi:hypothetical protein [Pseudobacteriovorax antillogorgiicola]|uniref:Uncharacterized protein n=1 Tax=Pseudobacteriovorax antillogorgiicola TaxID=1513793 RepID=A0A1Y6BE92_9BACT|nr:hypothetical protein [Pseudobacteriovorax antillogorgiicola]TCS58598.1 hypothetical protein EDD56_102111 [Pseudobacteriovorax antillogorgiicola]SME97039.1 hypothetical protein SAMN06296036_102332 [Pseudobacteriovorax antillogorgiicola]